MDSGVTDGIRAGCRFHARSGPSRRPCLISFHSPFRISIFTNSKSKKPVIFTAGRPVRLHHFHTSGLSLLSTMTTHYLITSITLIFFFYFQLPSRLLELGSSLTPAVQAAARSGGLRGTPGTAGLCRTETTARTLWRTLRSAWRTLRARVNLFSTESQET
ncbi:unnamed protein product [Nesidiocoris tenuis]|uniref:Uncharacterized protein n=1 Tax=Nesidiocoris tenuis TaxID=355587 RepID=A0A6H5HHC3_9HEMI|nr:unnamed protein product [Nesidiocoris tenuis]